VWVIFGMMNICLRIAVWGMLKKCWSVDVVPQKADLFVLTDVFTGPIKNVHQAQKNQTFK
jgi:hypothetical protein